MNTFEQLLESLDSSEFCGDDEIKAPRPPMAGGRAHAAHRQFEKSIEAVTATLSAATPSAHLGLHSPTDLSV